MARDSIGLDIGTRAVRLAEVQISGGRPTVSRFGRILLPVGAVDHGEIQDPQAVASAITTLYKRLGLTGKAVHVGMANRRVVVRVIELPVMSRSDLEGAIRFQAQDHIPIPLAEAVMDFEVLEEVEGPEGQKLQRVLVVAAERATIQPLLATLQAAHLEPASLELNAYPLVRAFGGNGDTADHAEAIVDVGAGVTNVVVHQGGKIKFTRILPTFGGDEFTAAIAQSLGVSRDDAETMKRDAGKALRDHARHPIAHTPEPDPTPPADEAEDGVEHTDDVEQHDEPHARPHAPRRRPPLARRGVQTREAPVETSTDPSVDPAVRVIEPMLDRFVTEVRGSIDFYLSQPGAPELARIVLTGGGSLMGGVAERLAAAVGVPVEPGHPFDRIPIGKVKVTQEETAVAEPFIGIAVGLALAKAGK